MTLILTNDDGIDAPGIQALYTAVETLQLPNYIVAPKDHHSGCSHQLTTHRPMFLDQRGDRTFALDGTPADCTRIAVTHLCPDATWVLSGINAGGNLGADIYVSGTVAAVREAALHRIPGIAISHFIKRGRPIDWAIATRLTQKVLTILLTEPLRAGCFWNVNLPHITADDPDPAIIPCVCCTQPLPTDIQIEGNQIRYVGQYPKRARDPGADVDLCFQGNITISQICLW
jgi:5'-nucleotidase